MRATCDGGYPTGQKVWNEINYESQDQVSIIFLDTGLRADTTGKWKENYEK